MESVINPWWIYFASVAEKLGLAFSLLGVGSFACTLFYLMARVIDGDWDKVKAKWALIPVTIFILGAFIPSKTTVYTMIAASMATKENVKDAAGFTADTIIEIMKKIDEYEKEKRNGNE